MHTESQFGATMATAAECLREIMVHGFGKLIITVETVENRKRKVLIEAANSYKHTVPADEIPQVTSPR